MAHLELKNLVKDFGAFRAVEGVTLSIEKGEFVSLLGASGCGKTTTLRMIAGLTPPTNGEIFLNGKNITNTPAKSRNMGMVFQSYALFPTMTVFENICFGLRVRKRSNHFIQEKVHQLLELGHLEGLAKRFPAELSGGQQQRVALLRALAIEPDVLLLDEPLSNLDAKLRVDIRKEIKKMQSMLGITTVYVTHDQEEALAVSDRITVMNHGVIQQSGTPLEIYSNPTKKFVSDFIGRSNFLRCSVEGDNLLRFEEVTFSLEVPQEMKNKDSLFVSFRPQYSRIHDVSFKLPSDFRGLAIPAKFSFETFLGTMFQLEATTRENQIIVIEMSIEERKEFKLDKNDDVLVTVPEHFVYLYSE